MLTMKDFWKSFDKLMDGVGELVSEIPEYVGESFSSNSIEQTTINGKQSLKINGVKYTKSGKYWFPNKFVDKDGNFKKDAR